MVNVFASYDDPIKCAVALDDKRLSRMAFESCELLSAAILNIRLGMDTETPTSTDDKYAPPYSPKLRVRRHPCAKWVSESRGNYLWLLQHFKALAEEHKLRYAKADYCAPFDYYQWLKRHASELPNMERTPFHEAMPVEIKDLPYSTFTKYRLTLIHKHLYLDVRDSTWSKHKHVKRSPPKWMFDPRGRKLLRDIFGKPVNNPAALRM